MATHSSILAWRIPWTGEPGGLLSVGSQESDTTERLTQLHSTRKPGRWPPSSQRKFAWLVRAVSVTSFSGTVFRSLGSPVSLVPARGRRVLVSDQPSTVTVKVTQPGRRAHGTPTQIPALCLTEKQTAAHGGHGSCLR